jgi:hypothetical protein
MSFSLEMIEAANADLDHVADEIVHQQAGCEACRHMFAFHAFHAFFLIVNPVQRSATCKHQFFSHR